MDHGIKCWLYGPTATAIWGRCGEVWGRGFASVHEPLCAGGSQLLQELLLGLWLDLQNSSSTLAFAQKWKAWKTPWKGLVKQNQTQRNCRAEDPPVPTFVHSPHLDTSWGWGWTWLPQVHTCDSWPWLPREASMALNKMFVSWGIRFLSRKQRWQDLPLRFCVLGGIHVT